MGNKSLGFDSASWSLASVGLQSTRKLHFKITTINIGNIGGEYILDNPFNIKLRWQTYIQDYSRKQFCVYDHFHALWALSTTGKYFLKSVSVCASPIFSVSFQVIFLSSPQYLAMLHPIFYYETQDEKK